MENRGMSDTKKTKRMKENKRERERQRETDSVREREKGETGKNTIINDQAKHKLWCGNN